MYKCEWDSFIKCFSKADALTYHFHKIRKDNPKRECYEPAFLYVGIKALIHEKGNIIQGIGATYCKIHAPLVLTIMNRINSTTKRYEPNDYELIVLG